ncbi:hypothetical protein DSC_03795 [Pseudoxanthomonas spadix BD-a59]|jgi:hypothetical protein|uniref:Uncharacterized protein n=1 Tax=Pseudoxanthomonas spadix (strain BD-a59) TaxID=1045855 RepID=G7UNI1_PSEUP|nr:hypothetical protein [Pseudoxanthomonas spadix]AER55412.1 hypothetical protein DSC_03795 [Pseudoxanthomonas spadix BD-a59]
MSLVAMAAAIKGMACCLVDSVSEAEDVEVTAFGSTVLWMAWLGAIASPRLSANTATSA